MSLKEFENLPDEIPSVLEKTVRYFTTQQNYVLLLSTSIQRLEQEKKVLLQDVERHQKHIQSLRDELDLLRSLNRTLETRLNEANQRSKISQGEKMRLHLKFVRAKEINEELRRKYQDTVFMVREITEKLGGIDFSEVVSLEKDIEENLGGVEPSGKCSDLEYEGDTMVSEEDEFGAFLESLKTPEVKKLRKFLAPNITVKIIEKTSIRRRGKDYIGSFLALTRLRDIFNTRETVRGVSKECVYFHKDKEMGPKDMSSKLGEWCLMNGIKAENNLLVFYALLA